MQAVKNLSITPNPSSGAFIISFDAYQSQPIQIKIYDLVGQLIQEEYTVKVMGSYSKQINLGNAAKGMYILQIRAGNEIINNKIEIN